MGTEEGLKALCDEWDELEKLGYVVTYHVKIKDQEHIHPKFRGKTGKVYIDDPREDFVEVDLDDKSCSLRCTRGNYEILSEPTSKSQE
jgi:hypothetical protein